MRVRRTKEIMTVDDGQASQYGIGVVVPSAIAAVFLFNFAQSEPMLSRATICLGAFLCTVIVIVLFRAPRAAAFNLNQREARLVIGWPPFLGRSRVIPFDAIINVFVYQPLRLSDDFGSARAALQLANGSKVFLSTYDRSPKLCRQIVSELREFSCGDNTG